MWLMSTVNSILFGEIVGGQRGELSASIGYTRGSDNRTALYCPQHLLSPSVYVEDPPPPSFGEAAF